jgi:hypothetical protein
MDESSPTEDALSASQNWPLELAFLSCFQHLHQFTLEGFKGGALESSLACAILELSPSLKYLTLEFDTDLHHDLLHKVKRSILMVKPKFYHEVSIQIRKATISGVKGK